MHPRAIGVKDSGDTYIHLVLTMVIEEKRFGATFAFVIACTRTDWIDVAEIIFCLGMFERIAIDFAGGSLKYPRLAALGKPKHIDRPEHGSSHRGDRIILIVNRTRWAGQIEYPANFDINRQTDVMAHQLKIRFAKEMANVVFGARIKIIYGCAVQFSLWLVFCHLNFFLTFSR